MSLINCPECGKEVSDLSEKCIHCGFPISEYVDGEEYTEIEEGGNPNGIYAGKLKTGKENIRSRSGEAKKVNGTSRLVIGIISIVLSCVTLFQSCIVGIANTLSDNGEKSGIFGFLLSVFMLVAGILGICCRKIKSGIIVAGLFLLIGGVVAYQNSGSYLDLNLWSIISIIFGITFVVSAIAQRK